VMLHFIHPGRPVEAASSRAPRPGPTHLAEYAAGFTSEEGHS